MGTILPDVPAPLLLVDAPACLYRAFYALPDSITDGDGNPVNALLGSVNQVLWCVDKYQPRAVVLCFGAEAADYRTDVFPAYHADRPPVPDELAPQWADAPAFFGAFVAHAYTTAAAFALMLVLLVVRPAGLAT